MAAVLASVLAGGTEGEAEEEAEGEVATGFAVGVPEDAASGAAVDGVPAAEAPGVVVVVGVAGALKLPERRSPRGVPLQAARETAREVAKPARLRPRGRGRIISPGQPG